MGGEGGLGPDPPASTCGSCGNRADPVTLSGWWESRSHPDPLEVLTHRQKFLAPPMHSMSNAI